MTQHNVRSTRLITSLFFGATVLLATPLALADSAQLQVLKAQLQQVEQLGMTEMADSLRELIASMEAEEAGSPMTTQAVRTSYFAEIGRPELERCDYARDVQFDTICAAAMLRYNDYLAVAAGTPDQAAIDEAWHRHEATAKVFLQGISQDGHGVRAGDAILIGSNAESRSSPPVPAAPSTMAEPAAEPSAPCPEGQYCATRQ